MCTLYGETRYSKFCDANLNFWGTDRHLNCGGCRLHSPNPYPNTLVIEKYGSNWSNGHFQSLTLLILRFIPIGLLFRMRDTLFDLAMLFFLPVSTPIEHGYVANGANGFSIIG